MKRRLLRSLVVVLGVLVLLVVCGPFLVPVPPLEGVLPPEQLADPDSRFVEINGVDVHYKRYGQGEPVFLLLHGFGASTFSWREVAAPLAERGMVIAYDRPAFGLTGRPLTWDGQNPYGPEAQVALALGLLDSIGVEQAIFVGNSAGGTVSVQVALAHPERVQALVLVDAAIYTGGGARSDLLRWLGQTPQGRRLGPLFARQIQSWGRDFARSAWHDPTQITPEIWEGYTKPTRVENWDRALWEFTLASRPLGLPERLDELKMPVLVITGDDDRIVPTEQSLRLARELPGAQLAVMTNCGHTPHEECPAQFLEALESFLAGLP